MDVNKWYPVKDKVDPDSTFDVICTKHCPGPSRHWSKSLDIRRDVTESVYSIPQLLRRELRP